MNLEKEAAQPPPDDTSAPSKAASLPGELLELILQCLCIDDPAEYDRRGKSPFDPLLALCSLVCRHWAAQIRPALFFKVIIKSGDAARKFASLVRSSVAVPGSLRMVVRKIELYVDGTSRPWMYHIWALLRGAALPNLLTTDLTIEGASRGDVSAAVWRDSDESRLDIGFPRTPPSARPFLPGHLILKNLTLRSHKSLLRCLGSYCAKDISCNAVRWPEGDAVSAPAGRLLSRLSSHPPNDVGLSNCTAISPFLWTLVTTQPFAPGTAQRLLYISTAQIDVVVDTFRLFSDECRCRKCKEATKRWLCKLRLYTDPTDDAMKCLSCRRSNTHTLTMQVQPSGGVSRVCLIMDLPYVFLPPSDGAPSDRSPAAPADSMLARLDRLCEALGDTLRELVIAYLPYDPEPALPAQAALAATVRALRDELPRMAGRDRLVFRVSRTPGRALGRLYGAAVQRVFERGGLYWKDIDLDGRWSPEL